MHTAVALHDPLHSRWANLIFAGKMGTALLWSELGLETCKRMASWHIWHQELATAGLLWKSQGRD